jgi:hypothetical protein
VITSPYFYCLFLTVLILHMRTLAIL